MIDGLPCTVMPLGGVAMTTSLGCYVRSGLSSTAPVISAGYCLDYVELLSGQSVDAYAAGTINQMIVSSGAVARIRSGAEVRNNLTVYGTAFVSSGGMATCVDIYSGGLNCAGKVQYLTVYSGASAVISSGGNGSNIYVSGGVLTVSSGGTANNTYLASGAILSLQSGATLDITDDTILSSALVIPPGAVITLNGTIFSLSNGSITSSGATVSGGITTIQSGATVSGGYFIGPSGNYAMLCSGVLSGAVCNPTVGWGTVIYGSAHGCLFINGVELVSGGRIENCTITGYGDHGGQGIMSNCLVLRTRAAGYNGFYLDSGLAVDTVIADLGTLCARSNGVLSRCTARNSGIIAAVSGGVALDCVASGSGQIGVNTFGIASGAIVSSGGSMIVLSGGMADITTLSSGGSMIVSSGGTALNVDSQSGATVISRAGAFVTYKESV